MITIPGYQLVEKLYESAKSLVYRGWRNSDQSHVILKILKQEYSTLEGIARFKLEYDIKNQMVKFNDLCTAYFNTQSCS